MASQIKFFKKNIIDLSNDAGSITVTDAVATNSGNSFVNYVRNRNNQSAWLTTGSTDAANTQLDIDLGQGRDVSEIILIKHNWKAFTIQYSTDGVSYSNFSTSIAETTNTSETSRFSFTKVDCRYIRIIITGAQVVNADKQLYQLLITELIGTLEGWPIIKSPTHDTAKKVNQMLSNKVNVVESLGAFSVDLNVANWKNAADLVVIETIYFSRETTLVWLCGGEEAQFSVVPVGYRLEDFYLMRPVDSYQPEFVKGLYMSGLNIKISLKEAI